MTSREFPVKQINWVDCHALSEYFFEQYHIEVNVLEYFAEVYDYTLSNGSYVTITVTLEGPDPAPEDTPETVEGMLARVEEWTKSDADLNVELLLWHQMYLGNIADGTYYVNIEW